MMKHEDRISFRFLEAEGQLLSETVHYQMPRIVTIHLTPATLLPIATGIGEG
ncbi:MAG: hypothetical protein HYY40_12525 [Bacteroidetes bacterium]|nr:hypothetical protein [Bacteroidota bacterium]